MNAATAPHLAGVVGSPIGHSLSPVIHKHWLARADLRGDYQAIEVAPGYDPFSRAMDRLQADGYAGVNITLPHKENALRYADGASDLARCIGAANMLTFKGGAAFADNSDAPGFAAALAATSGENPAIGRALVLGAGGGARAIVNALQSLGASSLAITNRTQTKAEGLAENYGLEVVDWDDRNDALGGADLIVNTTSLGMTGQPALELDYQNICSETIIADIVYAPLVTPLLGFARENANPVVDGLSMLMHQAKHGSRQWFGLNPQVDDALRELLIATLEKRSAI